MKTQLILLFTCLLMMSCQRSQFSTTTRHERNGRVYYENHHPLIWVKKVNLKKPGKEKYVEQNISSKTEVLKLVKIKNLSAVYDNILPSGSSEMIACASIKKQNAGNPAKASVRSIIRKAIKGGHWFNLPVNDSISKARRGSHDSKNDENALARLSLIFSLIGLFPLVGLPFAIMGISFGKNFLKKKLSKSKYTDMAAAGVTLGIIGTVINIIAIIMMVIFIFQLTTAFLVGCASITFSV